MKTTATFLRLGARVAAGLALLLCVHAAHAAGTVVTVGGGPYSGNLSPFGYTDGDTELVSQFNGPSGPGGFNRGAPTLSGAGNRPILSD